MSIQRYYLKKYHEENLETLIVSDLSHYRYTYSSRGTSTHTFPGDMQTYNTQRHIPKNDKHDTWLSLEEIL